MAMACVRAFDWKGQSLNTYLKKNAVNSLRWVVKEKSKKQQLVISKGRVL